MENSQIPQNLVRSSNNNLIVDLWISPNGRAYIYLKFFTPWPDGTIILTEDCVCPEELAGQIKRLKCELDNILLRYKKMYGKREKKLRIVHKFFGIPF